MKKNHNVEIAHPCFCGLLFIQCSYNKPHQEDTGILYILLWGWLVIWDVEVMLLLDKDTS